MFKELIHKFCLWYLKRVVKDNCVYNNNCKNDYIKYKKIPISQIKFNIQNKFQRNLNDIFFINVSSIKELEKYQNNCLQSFKKINTDLKLNVLNYTYDEFFKLNNIWNILKSNNLDKKEKLSRQELDLVIQNYSYKIIYQYGGIYSSFKNYFVKQLDSKLLEKESFICTIFNNGIIKTNSCFYGYKKEFNQKIDILYPPLNQNIDIYNTLKKRFYDGDLDFKPSKYDHYIYNFGI